MIRLFAVAVSWLLLAGCAASGGTVETAGSVGVDRYCEKFAKAYLERNAIAYTGLFVRTDKKTDLMKWFSNVFSPSDSRFTAGYDCRFTAHSGEGRTRTFSVGLFLTGTEEFAHYGRRARLHGPVAIRKPTPETGSSEKHPDGFTALRSQERKRTRAWA